MEIRELTLYNEKSPVTGYSCWIVVEHGRRVQLLHPYHLTELILTEYEFKIANGEQMWPENGTGCGFSASRFIQSFKKRIAFFLENKRPFPVQTVAKTLAAFEEISVDEAMAFIGSLSVNEFGESISCVSNKANRVYDIKPNVDLRKYFQTRPGAILNALKEHGPSTIYTITSLVDKTLKTKSDKARVVTYFVNKLASEGILEILT